MQADTALSKKLTRIFFPLAALEGLLALVFLLKDPSSENALLMGYSASRLAMAAAALLLTIIMAWSAWQTITKRPTLPRWLKTAETWLLEKSILLPLTILLTLAALLSIAYHIFFSAPLPLSAEVFLTERPQWMMFTLRLYAMHARLLPLTLWTTALILQTLVLWGFRFAPAYRDLRRDGDFGRAAGMLLLAGAALFHWLVLLLQLKVFLVIRGWKWYFWQKEVPQPIWLFPFILIIALVVVWFVFRNPKHAQRKLIALMLLGAGLQIGFGFLAGGGFESLRMKYADSVFNNYAEAAAEDPGLWHAMTNYEADYGDDWYLGTKPPGVLAVYILTEKAASVFMPSADSAGRFLSLTTFAAYVFPFLAFLVLLPLYHLARKLDLSRQEGLLASALYVTVPSVLLIPLFLDQALYPLVFISVLLLACYAWEKKSWQLTMLTGAAVYLALYLGFSLLALVPLIPLWFCLQMLFHPKEHPFKEGLKLGLAFGGGLLAAFLLFRLAVNYDILLRYSTAMANHRRAKEYAPGLEQWLHAFLLNHAELLTWNGFPFILLALVQMTRSLIACIRRQSQPLDELAAAFFLTYGALNLFGQTNGEVQRLWLFMIPLFSLLAASETMRLSRANRGSLSLLFLLQWVTAWLLFTFQDFYG
jgi:hypothetical protein